MRILLAGLVLASSAQALELKSPDLKDGAVIAAEQIYTRCGGKNVSPALAWSGVPRGAKSLALTMIDMSVKPAGWTHWIVLDLPANATGLEKGALKLPAGAHGVHSNFGDDHYDGPCPPAGSGEHRYVITLWALGTKAPALASGMPADKMIAALALNTVDQASISGTVRR